MSKHKISLLKQTRNYQNLPVPIQFQPTAAHQNPSPLHSSSLVGNWSELTQIHILLTSRLGPKVEREQAHQKYPTESHPDTGNMKPYSDARHITNLAINSSHPITLANFHSTIQLFSASTPRSTCSLIGKWHTTCPKKQRYKSTNICKCQSFLPPSLMQTNTKWYKILNLVSIMCNKQRTWDMRRVLNKMKEQEHVIQKERINNKASHYCHAISSHLSISHRIFLTNFQIKYCY